MKTKTDCPRSHPKAHVLSRRAHWRQRWTALSRLPDAQRRAFVLLQLEGLSLEVVSDLEGVPVGTVKSRLHRARVALMVDLGPLLERGGAP